ncbi:hypothetical protein TWF192_007317 [Orbilia oligospora]|uniref:Serine protease n=1 Tax=Orbilia oligospora TaxID=2813651 RepID=A0A6G1M652_ORBOL|nr:hypothetical protein TWF679_002627 [Orbilia oligospora]KAF3204639.1 hypothetical protein TWF191_002202 [Orbilia oligospora]KAF3245843.1 hypothetical protein TWF192_007317 [Orbilia oligospora]
MANQRISRNSPEAANPEPQEVFIEGIDDYPDMISSEVEQMKRLREYIISDKSVDKRPSIIKFKVSWKLRSRVPAARGRISERFEAAYSTGIAFAITPTVLLTARHIFRPPTVQEVLNHHPDMEDNFEEIEEGVKYDHWVISSIKWCIDDSDAGYKLSAMFVLGSDFVVLQSLEKEHHRLALTVDTPGQRCWSIRPDRDNELVLKAGVWNWKEKGVKGATTCPIDNGYSGSPLLNTTGHVIGIITHTIRGPEDIILLPCGQTVPRIRRF